MTEQRRKLEIWESSCDLLSPRKTPKQNARKHNMSVRSLGHQSPPVKDHYRQPSSKRTCLRGVGKFGLPSQSWINTIVKAKQKSKASKCHQGFGIMSSSTHGNTASSWSESPQSPPEALEIQSGAGVCTI